MTIEERIAAYLDGQLDEQARAELEEAFVDEHVAELLGEELMLRELLASMPPAEVPLALLTKLDHTLGVGATLATRLRGGLERLSPKPAWALEGLRFGARAVAAAPAGVAVATAGVSAVRATAAGVSTLQAMASGAATVQTAASNLAALGATLDRATSLPFEARADNRSSSWWQRATRLLRRSR